MFQEGVETRRAAPENAGTHRRNGEGIVQTTNPPLRRWRYGEGGESRSGMKIRRALQLVWVRLPPPAPPFFDLLAPEKAGHRLAVLRDVQFGFASAG